MSVEQRARRRIKHAIPVSVPVKKYLSKWYPDEYEIKRSDYLGMWCINAMCRKSNRIQSFCDSQDDRDYLEKKKLTELWTFVSPIRHQYQIVIPKLRVIEFNYMMMKYMYAEIFMEMEVRRVKGDPDYIQTTIEDFRDRYGIWDKYFMDETIRKAYLRFRKRSSEQQISPAFIDFFPGKILAKL